MGGGKATADELHLSALTSILAPVTLPAPGLTQAGTPSLEPGKLGTAQIQFENAGNADSRDGIQATFRAPSGTSFASGTISQSVSGQVNTVNGYVTPDGKLLFVNEVGFTVPSDEVATWDIDLKSDAGNLLEGDINDGGIAVTGGWAFQFDDQITLGYTAIASGN